MEKTYRDKITGFQGVATGYVNYISGCNQVLLAPHVSDDGSMRDSYWFDVQRVEVISGSGTIILHNEQNLGFDKAAPKR